MRKAANQVESGGAKTAEARTVKHGVSRLLPYAPPWLMWIGVLIIALTGWALWGESPWYPLATLLAHQGALGVSRRMTKAKPIEDVMVVLALSSIVGSTLFSVMVGVLGPTSVLISLWGGIGFTLCMYWTIRRMHLTGDMAKAEAATSTNVQKILDSLNGAKTGNVIEHETGVIEIPAEVDRGRQNVEDLKQTIRDIEQVTGLRPNAGKLVPSNEDAGAATMKFYPTDQLKGIQPWIGPSAFGESVAIPIPIGRRMDYTTVYLNLVADHRAGRSAPQFLIMGMNGAGKSEFCRMIVADILTRKDVTVWMHDHVKGLQTMKPLIEGGGLDWVSMSLANGKAMLVSVRDAIRARARWLGMNDHDIWEEGCGLNLLVVWLEEANDLGQLKDLIKLVKEGRSAGVIIFISMQRASYTALDTETRAQLSGNICFGVESSMDASFGLSEHIRDRGANPEVWKNSKPGYAYIEAPGITDEEAALEARMFFAEKPDVIDAIQRGNMVRRPLVEEADLVTVNAAGKAYADRLPVEAFLPGHPLFSKAVGLELGDLTDKAPANANETESDKNVGNRVARNDGPVGGVDDNRGVDADPTGVSSASDAQDDEDDDVDEDEAEAREEAVTKSLETDEPFPEMPEVALAVVAKPVEQLTRDECRARVQLYLATVFREGKKAIGVPDIEKMTPPIKYKREWIRNELHRLTSGDADTNGWRLSEPEDGPAGAFDIVAPVRG